MRNIRRFQLDELLLRPGTYFNPQTEVMVVVDDSPEVDNEIFETADVEASDWVQISDETPLDERQRDDMIERFQQSHRVVGAVGEDDEPADDEDEDLDPDEEEDEVEVEVDELDPHELHDE